MLRPYLPLLSKTLNYLAAKEPSRPYSWLQTTFKHKLIISGVTVSIDCDEKSNSPFEENGDEDEKQK